MTYLYFLFNATPLNTVFDNAILAHKVKRWFSPDFSKHMNKLNLKEKDDRKKREYFCQIQRVYKEKEQVTNIILVSQNLHIQASSFTRRWNTQEDQRSPCGGLDQQANGYFSLLTDPKPKSFLHCNGLCTHPALDTTSPQHQVISYLCTTPTVGQEKGSCISAIQHIKAHNRDSFLVVKNSFRWNSTRTQ